MLSIIVCSVNENVFKQFEKSVGNTIGIPFEIVKIDNNNEQLSLCMAYNKGAALSNYNHLAFIHEDVIFHTAGWGTILLGYFGANKNIGCISVAGGLYKTKAPSHWISFAAGYEFLDQSYLIQHYKDGSQKLRDTWTDKSKKIQEAVLMDGVFLAFDKRSGITFDEATEGFHGYDITVCLDAINKGYKNFVTHEILLEHLSSGSFNSQWIKAIHRFHKKNAQHFPLQAGNVDLNASDLEKKTMARFVELSFLSGERKIGLYWWSKLLQSHPFFSKHLYLTKVFLSHLQKGKAENV